MKIFVRVRKREYSYYNIYIYIRAQLVKSGHLYIYIHPLFPLHFREFLCARNAKEPL